MQPALTSAASAAERSRRRAFELDRPIASALALDPAHLDVIEQSYQRCAAIGLSRTQAPDFAPLGRTDLNLARERHRRLYTHAAPVMEMLYEQIVNTQSMVVLTDVCGTIIHSIGDDDFLEKASKVALQPGVNWSESAKGTNAIGTALVSESATLVHADEHFMHANHFLTCSAAPIFDPRGNMLGVLDVTGDHRRYHQHTMGLVKMSARMIENHWLSDDFRHVMRLHLHARVECLGTLMEGILAISRDGRVLGANRTALDHLGLSGAAVRTHTVTSLLGTTVGALVDHFRSPLAAPLALHLPGGTLCHVQARFDWAAWYGLRHPATSEAGRVTDVEALAPRVTASGATGLAIPAPAEAEPAPPAAPRPGPADAPCLRALDTGDARMREIVGRLRKLLDRDLPLLLIGETGTGKEALARAVHADSRRAAQPFVTVQCSAIPEALLEVELFGCVPGAVEGAGRQGLPGRLREAQGGTLFLDEIGGLPLGLQARLLRVLTERRAAAVGSLEALPVDVTLIAATQRPLRERVEAHGFREDLYYRLNSLMLTLPPLRERSDLPALATAILAEQAQGAPVPQLSPRVLQRLQAWHWPGNLRELDNLLRTAGLLAAGEAQIGCGHLDEAFVADTDALLAPTRDGAATAAPVAQASTALPATAADPTQPDGTLEARELAMIRQVLEAHGGNISAASRQLGISRNTIYRRLYWKPAG